MAATQVASLSGSVKLETEGKRKNTTLICAPLMAESIDQLLIEMRKAKSSGADLVEIRLDYLKSFSPDHDLQVLIKDCHLPTLFTYRFIE